MDPSRTSVIRKKFQKLVDIGSVIVLMCGRMKSIRLPSGLRGWQGRLHEVYTSSEEFEAYCNIYAIHTRIGYKSPAAAWKANPLIQGSVNPSDLRRVPSVRLKRYPKDVVIAYARKNNTKAAARRLAQVDSGHYTISR